MSIYDRYSPVRTETRSAFCAVCLARLPEGSRSETCSTAHTRRHAANTWEPFWRCLALLVRAWEAQHPGARMSSHAYHRLYVEAMDTLLGATL